jgi:pyridoxine 4-dehydrogenase
MSQVLGKTVGPIGYGLMGFTWRPQPTPIADAVETMKAALNNGATLWNGAEFYGTPEHNSMTLLKAYFTKYPEDADKVLLSIKGGSNVTTLAPEGSPEAIRRSANNILSQLGGVKKVDIFVIARRDRSVPLKDTLEVLQKEFVDTGKIGGVGISECSAETVREASKHTKVALAELELSLFSPDILKNGVAEACAQNNIPIIAYSPMSRGVSSS